MHIPQHRGATEGMGQGWGEQPQEPSAVRGVGAAEQSLGNSHIWTGDQGRVSKGDQEGSQGERVSCDKCHSVRVGEPLSAA